MNIDHRYNCRCDRCREADRITKPKRYVPQHILDQYREKRLRQEELDMKAGWMVIGCPHCHHEIKVKITSKIRCNKCGKMIE